MLNGRYDHFFPAETSQLPFFRLLGTPDKDKKHVIYETGHADLPHRRTSARASTGSTSTWRAGEAPGRSSVTNAARTFPWTAC